ncbi:MAG TPA: caspase family protein [Allosphingosinicella sp.]
MADPALIFSDEADRAGTHVLLIGIGDYPWLEGGAKCKTPEHHENAMGMGQLTSPPVSMRRLADWFLDGFANPDRPLASLAMLLSEKKAATYAHARAPAPAKVLPRGSIDDVKKAVAAWVKRAAGRRDNGLIFGFCGHGVQSSNPVLLCRDYGSNTESRFDGAIDFEQFRIALSTRQPDYQLLLVDACRTPDVENSLLGQATPGSRLIDGVSLTTRDNAPAMQSVEFATSLYTQSWGAENAPSLFSEALLEALASGGADRNDQWWVTTSQLHAALATYMARISQAEGLVQRPAAGQLQNFRISKPDRISVPLYVRSTEPAIWAGPLRLEARRGDLCAEEMDYVPPGDAAALQAVSECTLRLTNPSQKVADVVYEVHAKFAPNSPFADTVEQIIAYPPEVTCELPVGKRP